MSTSYNANNFLPAVLLLIPVKVYYHLTSTKHASNDKKIERDWSCPGNGHVLKTASTWIP